MISFERDPNPRPLPYQNTEQNSITIQQFNNAFWDKYKLYLHSNYRTSTVRAQFSYAKTYAYVLSQNNANDLLSLSEQKRLLVMKSLATLSKYLGCYDTWTNLKKRHQLKWTNNNTTNIINRLTDPRHSYDTMLMWLRRCITKLPKSDSNILLYCTLTGLRPTEACESISLIHTDLANYLDSKQMALMHFKYPDMFLRRTKKAYFSFITDEILDIAKSSTCRTYNSVRMVLRKHNLDANMNNCRKIFATFLRDNGITSETIDLLQGRSSQTVFANHYYKPDIATSKLRDLLVSLQDTITQ